MFGILIVFFSVAIGLFMFVWGIIRVGTWAYMECHCKHHYRNMSGYGDTTVIWVCEYCGHKKKIRLKRHNNAGK